MSTPTGARAVLSAILPTPDETLLLRACLHSGDAARSAWDAWCKRVGGRGAVLGAGNPARRRLLPLVLAAVERTDLTAATTLRTQLRAAYLHEGLRSRTIRSLCGAVIGVLRDHGVAAVVLGGVALAETAYAEPALRHCHDVDVLVRSDELSRAADLLSPHGFTRRPGRGRGACGVTLAHATGLPIALHGTPFRIPYYRQPFDDVWSRGRTAMIADVPARLPCPADQLVHVCGHASYSPSRASLQWACDAWGIIERADRIDWDLVLDVAVAARLAVPLLAMLDYLEDALEAPIPATVLLTLAKVASDTDAAGIDAALLGVVLGPRHHLRRAFRLAPDWRTRVALGRLVVVHGAAQLMGT